MDAAARRRLWMPVVVPPLLWASQGLLGWLFVALACPLGTARAPVWSLGTARLLVLLVSGVAIAGSVVAAVTSFRRWKSLGEPLHRLDAASDERLRYMALVGILVGVTLTLGIAFGTLPSLLVSACGEVR